MKFQRPPFRPKNNFQIPKQPVYENELPADEEEDDDSEGEIRRESEYLRRLTDEHKPVVVHMRTGENFAGTIEYYDRRFIRLTRPGAANLFIFKNDIKYLSEG